MKKSSCSERLWMRPHFGGSRQRVVYRSKAKKASYRQKPVVLLELSPKNIRALEKKVDRIIDKWMNIPLLEHGQRGYEETVRDLRRSFLKLVGVVE